MQSSIRALTLLLVVLGCLPGQAATPETDCGPYDVTYYEFGSLYFRGDNGNFSGIDKDLVEELSRRSGCQLNGGLDSRVRTWARLEDGTLAITVSALATPKRDKFVEVVPYLKSRNRVIVRKDRAGGILTLDGFNAAREMRLAVVRSFKHGQEVDDWINQLRAQGRVDEYADSNTVAHIVAIGRADAFLAEPLVWDALLKRNQLEDSVRIFDWFPRSNVLGGLALSRKLVRQQDAERLRSTILSMRKDGSLKQILLRYLSPDIVKDALP